MKLQWYKATLWGSYNKRDQYNDAMSTDTIAACDYPEPFLPCCIPLHFMQLLNKHNF
jgi:hypothetical protein